MFLPISGLSAFPLTPFNNGLLDTQAFAAIVGMLADSAVDSVTVLGSTGSYMYLDAAQREVVINTAVAACGNKKKLFAGVGDIALSQVLKHIAVAEKAGVDALLVAPVSYQPLSEMEVFRLYEAVSEHTALPVVVYDNPRTTHFNFSVDLYAKVARLPGIASIKIPPHGVGEQSLAERVKELREVLPSNVSLGISGDQAAYEGLAAGCDVWYSVIAGISPTLPAALVRAVQQSDLESARELHRKMQDLWDFYGTSGGSLKTVAGLAALGGYTQVANLPAPLLPLGEHDLERLAAVAAKLGL